MTCIGAIRTVKDDGSVVINFAGDSCITSSVPCSIMNIRKISKKESYLIASAGKRRVANLLHFTFDVPKNHENKKEPIKHIITSVIPAIKSMLDAAGELIIESNVARMDNELLLACDGRLYQIGVDFAVVEGTNYMAIGSGYVPMMSALSATESLLDPVDRLKRGLEAAQEHGYYVRGPSQFEEIVFDKEGNSIKVSEEQVNTLPFPINSSQPRLDIA